MEDKDQLSILLDELCYLCSKRNNINHARSKARWKRAYWKNALKSVRAWTYTDPKYVKFKKKAAQDPKDLKLQAIVNDIELKMESIKRQRSKPKRWINMGLYEIRINILKYEAEYVKAKHETMLFTLENKNRVDELKSILSASITYRDGYVVEIALPGKYIFTKTGLPVTESLYKKQIELRAQKHELNLAISNMIET